MDPEMIPKTIKNHENTHPESTWSEKRDFLKNSTSPTRELHFWGPRVPKTLPKSAAALLEACKMNFHTLSILYLYMSYIYLSSVIIGSSLSHFWYAELWTSVEVRISTRGSFSFKFRLWFLIDFWSQNWAKMEPNWEPESFQNRSKIWLIFWSIFGCDFDPKMVPKMAPKTIKNQSKINPEPHLFWKTWFSEK